MSLQTSSMDSRRLTLVSVLHLSLPSGEKLLYCFEERGVRWQVMADKSQIDTESLAVSLLMLQYQLAYTEK